MMWVATSPATSRHMRYKLWLLPSGPDQVNLLALREDQRSYHRELYSQLPRIMLKSLHGFNPIFVPHHEFLPTSIITAYILFTLVVFYIPYFYVENMLAFYKA